jgi:hypothetical protein
MKNERRSFYPSSPPPKKRAACAALLFYLSRKGLFCANADFAFLDTLSDNFISDALWNSFILLEDHRERTATLRDRTDGV